LLEKLKKKIAAEGGTTKGMNDGFQSRNAPRKARKYAFFDVNSGNLEFEYGGVQT
jgi:hypothetical protein